ncbi:MAG TPA: FG-GAP repeat protein, partial [Thermoanaerobaculia bacterium]|nr:FG-GAP repeat protein [Thermoanaerobaculia bacterium]
MSYQRPLAAQPSIAVYMAILGGCAVLFAGRPAHADPAILVQQAKVTANDPTTLASLGWSVAISGDIAVGGAPDYSFSSPGSAYVFVRSGTSWSEQQKLTPAEGAAGDAFGASVSISGDSIVVGAPFDDDAGNTSGSAYVFVRSGTTWSQQQKLTPNDPAPDTLFGFSVAISGDTAVVGSWGASNGSYASGAAYVFLRSG